MSTSHMTKVTPAGAANADSGMVGQTTLTPAVQELNSQHPQKWDDLGPHHFTNDHVRHKPVSPGVYRSRKG